MLGTILIDRGRSTITAALGAAGAPHAQAARMAGSFGAASDDNGRGTGTSPAVAHKVQLAFAHATQTVFYIMAAVLAVNFLVARLWLPRGTVEPTDEVAAPAAALT